MINNDLDKMLALKLLAVSRDLLKVLEDVHDVREYKTLLGFTTDMWAAENNIPDEETLKIFEDVAEAQKKVWADDEVLN